MSSAGDDVYEERRVVLETCRVARWRGYVMSSFYAITEDGQVEAESRPFRWRGRDAPPDRPGHRAALDGLIAELVEHGWHLEDAEGRQWYDRSLTRPRVVAVSVQRAEHAPARPPLVDSAAAGAAERRIADPLPQPPAVEPPPTARAVPDVAPR